MPIPPPVYAFKFEVLVKRLGDRMIRVIGDKEG